MLRSMRASMLGTRVYRSVGGSRKLEEAHDTSSGFREESALRLDQNTPNMRFSDGAACRRGRKHFLTSSRKSSR